MHILIETQVGKWKMTRNKEKNFTLDHLNHFSGKNGNPAFIAYDGKVYDVSMSSRWKDGRHMNVHSAGMDLTKFLINAPHKEEVFERFTIKGSILPDEGEDLSLVQKIADFYPHSILVHFPIAFSTIIPLFSILYLLTLNSAFESTSFFILFLNLLAAPAGAVSGAFSWKVKYMGTKTPAFSKKILFSILVFTITVICLIWRIFNPLILISQTSLSYVYLALQIINALIASLLGHTGGKIVFG